MARLDPERIDQARRMATHAHLVGDGMSEELATRWVEAWEVEAVRSGLEPGSAYWTQAWRWIQDRRSISNQPPS
jgi:hypothetical protein